MNLLDAFGLIVTFLSGMFTQAMINDSSARAYCRSDLLELKNAFEQWALQQINPSRRPEDDVIKNEEIKQILRQLDVHQAGLFIKPPTLKWVLESSLEYVLKSKKNSDDPSAKPAFLNVDLQNLWGEDFGRDYEAKKIKQIRAFLDANIFMRVFYKISNSLCDKL